MLNGRSSKANLLAGARVHVRAPRRLVEPRGELVIDVNYFFRSATMRIAGRRQVCSDQIVEFFFLL